MFLLNLIKEKKYPKLWELDVSANELDDLCIKEMTKMLKTQANVSSLHTVSFDGNNFDEALMREFNSVLLSSYNCDVCSFITCTLACFSLLLTGRPESFYLRVDMEGEKGNGGIQKNSLLSMTQEKMAKFIYGGYQKDKLEQVICVSSQFILVGTKRKTGKAETGGRGDCCGLFGVR